MDVLGDLRLVSAYWFQMGTFSLQLALDAFSRLSLVRAWFSA